MDRRMSDAGRSMLIELEGSRSHAYHDVAGFMTIGVGHMLTKDELTSGKIIIGDTAVKYRDGLDEGQIGVLLQQDLEEYEAAVNAFVEVELTQWEFDALVSFTFNNGARAFHGSTLRKFINDGRLTEAPEQFRKWIWAAGRTWDGLVRRREIEIKCWNGDLHRNEG